MTEKIVYINGTDWTAAGAEPKLAAVIAEYGWRVVNAPRPLPAAQWWLGDYNGGWAAWAGEFRHGQSFAAGPADDERLAREWDTLDAWPCELVDNAEIMRRLRVIIAEREMTEAEVMKRHTWAELARAYGLPWRDEPDYPPDDGFTAEVAAQRAEAEAEYARKRERQEGHRYGLLGADSFRWPDDD